MDFPYLLYADQIGEQTERGRARAGVGWLRAVTDLPTVAVDLWDGEFDLRSYWRSLKRTRAESVFVCKIRCPHIAEVLMLPYLVTRKYFVKRRERDSDDRSPGDAGLPKGNLLEQGRVARLAAC